MTAKLSVQSCKSDIENEETYDTDSNQKERYQHHNLINNLKVQRPSQEKDKTNDDLFRLIPVDLCPFEFCHQYRQYLNSLLDLGLIVMNILLLRKVLNS